MATETSVKASLLSLHDKPYPSLGLCVPQAILEDSTFTIAIINVTFYYSTTLASVYTSSTRRVVCIICGILPPYSETAAETISEGLKYKFFLGAFPQTPLVVTLHAHLCALCIAGKPPCKFLPTPVGRQTCVQTGKRTDREKDKKTNRQTGRQIDEQTGGQTETAIPCPR